MYKRQPKDRAITVRELIDSGLAENFLEEPFNLDAGTPPNTFVPIGGLVDLAVPPDVTSFSGTGAFQKIILSWDLTQFGNFAFTEVWRHTSNDIGSAIRVDTTRAQVWVDTVDFGANFYYWVRHISTSNIVGQFAGAVNVTTSKITDSNADTVIEAGAISAQEIAAGTITAAKMSTGTITAASGIIADAAIANANEILAKFETEHIVPILLDYPSVDYSFEGEQREQRDTLSSLFKNFALALFVVYVLLAVPFKSYLQPLIIMSAIPFGFTGAVIGHIIMGMNLAVLSIIGIVALSGVVVNDSLVMVDFINRYKRDDGKTSLEAALAAGPRRFRPILLTSITTFVGLFPLLIERSVQAQFLIPMAISLAYGVLFATLITLILVPTSYLIIEDIKDFFGRLSNKNA